MAVAEAQELKNSLAGFGKKKVKLIYLLLALSLSMLVFGGVFMSFYVRGRTPYIYHLLPTFKPSKPDYRYSILGEGDNMMVKPMDVAATADYIYVTDTLNGKVQVFQHTGEPAFTFGALGDGPGEFSFPYGIAIAANGEIFVADSYKGEISVFSKSGQYERNFGLGDELLTQPAGILIHGRNLYVCNLDPGYILVFDLSSGARVMQIGSNGDEPDQLQFPNDLTIGPDGNLYVSDTGNNRIQVYHPQSGEYIQTLPVDANLIYSPRGLAFNAYGQLLVVSKLNNEITVLDEKWNIVDTFGGDKFNLPNGIAIDSASRNIFVTDHISTLVFR
jgi:DNA-binding beta-propeller fold protein YncE